MQPAEPAEGIQLVLIPDASAVQRGLEELDAPVIGASVDGEGVAVLAAEGPAPRRLRSCATRSGRSRESSVITLRAVPLSPATRFSTRLRRSQHTAACGSSMNDRSPSPTQWYRRA